MYAEVVVNAPARRRLPVSGLPSPEGEPAGYSPLGLTFHYSIPERLEGQIAPGHLVRVPFGPRILPGVVLALSESAPVEETKDILGLIDPLPVLTPALLQLAHWISEHYLAPMLETVLMMLPPGLGRRPAIMVESLPQAVPSPDLTERQNRVLALVRKRGKMPLGRIGQELGMRGCEALVRQLEEKGLVVKREEPAGPSIGPRTEAIAYLAGELSGELMSSLGRAPKGRAILEYLDEEGPRPVHEILEETGTGHATLQRLVDKGLVALEEQEVWRDPLADFIPEPSPPPTLTPAQAAVWWEIEQSLSSPQAQAFLLHGVTGSGKTEIYLRALAHVLEQGRQALVLVPEIALTPQTIRRFGARFPDRIAVMHSRLSDGERYDTWRRAREGLVEIAIGSRSALFLPLSKPGLIVVDEEHEPSYKQERTPYYQAREVAKKLAELCGAKLILGSATPDLVSYYRAFGGEYRLLELPKRILGHSPRPEGGVRYLPLPPVEVVDMRAELRAGNPSILSRSLREALTATLAAKEQAILFLNRRGAAAFLLCRDCGHIPRCPRCHISFTYHSTTQDLLCHHCNRRAPLPTACPQCGGKRIRHFGTGTERVMQVVAEMFPQARLLRWDRDVTGRRGAHEAILSQFISHQADVLIGTQMIAKGLDLPLVTLVGVINADTALNFPDFRAAERTFQLLEQVAGRAGRSALGGKVIIQTYSPEHWCIQAASRHDYAGFYQRELDFRRQQGYPPFGELVRLVYNHASAQRCQKEAERLARVLHHKLEREALAGLDILGPAPAYFERLRGKYRWQVILRGREPQRLLEGVPFPLGWQIDVDPVNML